MDNLADVPDKAKVAIALRVPAQPQAPPTMAEEATASSISFVDDVDGSVTIAGGSLKKSYTRENTGVSWGRKTWWMRTLEPQLESSYRWSPRTMSFRTARSSNRCQRLG